MVAFMLLCSGLCTSGGILGTLAVTGASAAKSAGASMSQRAVRHDVLLANAEQLLRRLAHAKDFIHKARPDQVIKNRVEDAEIKGSPRRKAKARAWAAKANTKVEEIEAQLKVASDELESLYGHKRLVVREFSKLLAKHSFDTEFKDAGLEEAEKLTFDEDVVLASLKAISDVLDSLTVRKLLPNMTRKDSETFGKEVKGELDTEHDMHIKKLRTLMSCCACMRWLRRVAPSLCGSTPSTSKPAKPARASEADKKSAVHSTESAGATSPVSATSA